MYIIITIIVILYLIITLSFTSLAYTDSFAKTRKRKILQAGFWAILWPVIMLGVYTNWTWILDKMDYVESWMEQ